MPLRLTGGCHCGAVRFGLDSHTPHPYQLCYCAICRKTAGSGGYAINIMGVAASLHVAGEAVLGVYRAPMPDGAGGHAPSEAQRHFCTRCGAALWLFDPRWPDLIHPQASAVDTPLPVPPARTHIMLASKAPWVQPDIAPGDACFDAYPTESIEAWHKARGLWVA